MFISRVSARVSAIVSATRLFKGRQEIRGQRHAGLTLVVPCVDLRRQYSARVANI